MSEAREDSVGISQECLDPLVIHHLGAHDLCFEDETFGVYQQVRLTPLDLLASLISPIFAAYCGTLDRLAIHHAGAGLKGSLFKRTLRRSRIDRLIFSQVPSLSARF
jgi:hypothetical protein